MSVDFVQTRRLHACRATEATPPIPTELKLSAPLRRRQLTQPACAYNNPLRSEINIVYQRSQALRLRIIV